MTQKKYQVFISSTYEDLIEERKAAEETIIRCGDFPVGMEAFPAADEEQFDFIKTIISQCDYYLLIIAGRYGSLAPDGKSYTEKEYDYAVEIGVPVLVMLRGNREELRADKTERDAPGRDKLESFIATASNGRLRKSWASTEGLKLAIREALDHAKATKRRPGWIRGDHSASPEALEKLLATREENERLKATLASMRPQVGPIANIAGLETEIHLTGEYRYRRPGSQSTHDSALDVNISLGEVFELIAPHLMISQIDANVKSLIAKTVWHRRINGSGVSSSFSTSDEIFQTIKIQFMALNLVNVRSSKTTGGSTAVFWSLTDYGKQEMLRRRVLTVATEALLQLGHDGDQNTRPIEQTEA